MTGVTEVETGREGDLPFEALPPTPKNKGQHKVPDVCPCIIPDVDRVSSKSYLLTTYLLGNHPGDDP